MNSRKLILLTIVFCLGSLAALTSGLDTWQVRNPQPTLRVLRAVAYGNDTFVAVGEEGTVLTSNDGIEWNPQPQPTTNIFYAIVYAEGRFVAASGLGFQGAFLTSTDGTNWVTTQVVSEGLRSVTYGRGLFMAGGSLGKVFQSYDGTNWTERAVSGAGGFDVIVTFCGDYFIACPSSDGTTTGAVYSSDGTNWFLPSSAQRPGYAVAFGNGVFASANSINAVVVAARPTFWALRQTGLPSVRVNDMSFDSGMFVAVGSSGLIATSPDGTNWTVRASGVDQSLRGVAAGNGRWVAVGNGGMLLSSEDGITWTKRTGGVTSSLLSVSAHEAGLLATGVGGVLLQSNNGTLWTQTDSGTSNALFFSSRQNSIFLVGGTNGILRTGEHLDGLQTCLSYTTNALLATAFGNSLHIVVGARGTLLSSEDGVTWTPRSANTSNDLRGVCFAEGAFITVGRTNTVLRSTDGVSWEKRLFSTASPADLLNVVYGNGRFLAVTSTRAVIAISTNGLDWSVVPNLDATVLSGITFGHGMFAVTGLSGSVRTSPDGLAWTRRETGFSGSIPEVNGNSWFGVAECDGSFTVVGRQGAILQSGPMLLLTALPETPGTLDIIGPSRLPYAIEAYNPSNPVLIWEPLVILSNAPTRWTDPESPTRPSRLYRARFVP